MGEIKPFGVMLGLLGNIAIALGLHKLIGTGSCGGAFSPPCPDAMTAYLIMVPAGIIISVVAIFFGGGFLIFLGVFLAVGIGSLWAGFTGDAETATFGKLFGAGFVGIPLLIILIGLFANRAGAAKMQRAQNLVATGARGVGTITEVRDTGITINDNPRVELTMRIQPEDGSVAFDAEKTITASRIAIPRAGDRFPVWYDRADPSNWVYGTDMDPSQTPREIQELFALAAAPQAAAPASVDGIADELSKLNDLRLKGVLTDAEFEAAKGRLLNPSQP